MTSPTPYGWTALNPETISYEFGEAKFGKAPNDIPANPTGEAGGEDEYHSESVSADSDRGAAKVTGGAGSYGGTSDYKPEKDSKDTGDTGSIDLPIGHAVIENGIVQGRNYYLVWDVKTEKFYGVIPNYKEGQEFRSRMKPHRTDVLGDIYQVLSASLPDDLSGQLMKRFPETAALTNVYCLRSLSPSLAHHRCCPRHRTRRRH